VLAVDVLGGTFTDVRDLGLIVDKGFVTYDSTIVKVIKLNSGATRTAEYTGKLPTF